MDVMKHILCPTFMTTSCDWNRWVVWNRVNVDPFMAVRPESTSWKHCTELLNLAHTTLHMHGHYMVMSFVCCISFHHDVSLLEPFKLLLAAPS